ncbi:MAG: T9SS type A sorting domain-containing protein, partial [Chitinophagales bacterium]
QTWHPLQKGVTNGLSDGFDQSEVMGLYTSIERNQLLVCGNITHVDIDKRASGFAAWDNSQWISVDTSIGSWIKAITTFNNEIIIGISQTGGATPDKRIQRLDGSQWHSFGSGLDTNGSVNVLSADNNHLYIGGYFDSIDGNAAQSIAAWDGVAWNNMNGGIENTDTSSNSYRAIHCIYVDENGDVYAGGDFTHAGNAVARSIAKWDGSNWHSLSNSDFKLITSIEKYNGEIYVAGIINTARKIGKWDGNDWEIITTPHPSHFKPYYLRTFNGYLFAAENQNFSGSTKVLSWDGNEWSTVGSFTLSSNSTGMIFALEVFQNELYVGGRFDSVNGMAAKNIAKLSMPPVSVEEQELENLQLTLSPNPARSNQQINFERSMANEAAQLHLYDLQGKLIESIRIPSGEKRSTFSLEKASGVYFYQYQSMENPRQNQSGKLLLLK